MIKIQIGDKSYSMPESWSELKLGRWIKATSLAVGETDEITKNVALVSAIAGIPEDDLLDLPATEFRKLQELSTALADLKPGEPAFELEIAGVKYGLATNISQMTTAEYLDLDTLVTDQENLSSNLALVMAILYRPIGKDGRPERYRPQDVEARATLFLEEMPCSAVWSSLSFSSAVAQASLDSGRDYISRRKEALRIASVTTAKKKSARRK
jgi:hypothetical protein